MNLLCAPWWAILLTLAGLGAGLIALGVALKPKGRK